MRSYKDLTSKIECSKVDTLREMVRDESWRSAGTIAEQIFKNIDPAAWQKAAKAGIQIASEVDDIEMYDTLCSTWTDDLAIITPSILSELKEAFDPASEDRSATLLLDLLARATVLIVTIVSADLRAQEYNNKNREYDPEEYED